MPGLILEQIGEYKKMYLKNLYDEINIKDIVERNKIKRVYILNELLNYLAAQIHLLQLFVKLPMLFLTLKKNYSWNDRQLCYSY